MNEEVSDEGRREEETQGKGRGEIPRWKSKDLLDLSTRDFGWCFVIHTTHNSVIAFFSKSKQAPLPPPDVQVN